MNRRNCTALVGWLAVSLIVVGFVVIGLSYVVVVPIWLGFAIGAVAVVTVCVGVVLCYPYLTRGNGGFVLGPAAGTPPRWMAAFLITAVLVVVVLIVSSGSDHGTPARAASGAYVLDHKETVTVVTRDEWLRASDRQTRVVVGFSNFFLCIAALWCAACARAPAPPLPLRTPIHPDA